MFLLMMGT